MTQILKRARKVSIRSSFLLGKIFSGNLGTHKMFHGCVECFLRRQMCWGKQVAPTGGRLCKPTAYICAHEAKNSRVLAGWQQGWVWQVRYRQNVCDSVCNSICMFGLTQIFWTKLLGKNLLVFFFTHFRSCLFNWINFSLPFEVWNRIILV